MGEILKPGGKCFNNSDAVCFIALDIPHCARGKLTGIIVWMDLISRLSEEARVVGTANDLQ